MVWYTIATVHNTVHRGESLDEWKTEQVYRRNGELIKICGKYEHRTKKRQGQRHEVERGPPVGIAGGEYYPGSQSLCSSSAELFVGPLCGEKLVRL